MYKTKKIYKIAENTWLERLSYWELLNTFLERELLLRKENGLKHRLRNAKFPLKKYLEDFDRDKYGTKFKGKFDELETLKFIDNKENIILFGTPGAGRTHYYSIGLGVKACTKGKTVLFVSVPNLIIELKEAMSLNQLNSYKRKFERYDLVILDELGYISFDKTGFAISQSFVESQSPLISS